MSIAAFIPVIGAVLERILPDPKVAAEAKIKLIELEQAGQLKELEAGLQLAAGQVEINKIEAASQSLLKSGWRPAAGWVCVFGLFYAGVFRPVGGWIMGSAFGWQPPPDVDMSALLTLLVSMLGLGGYRTLERLNGKA